jgi:proliferating cell nuclear antigen
MIKGLKAIQSFDLDMSITSSAKPNANGNLFEVRTVQSAAFRTLIEGLKEILAEANLEFDQTGIRIIDVDETHTVLTYLRLNADKFEYFYCPAKFILGVNMMYLFKLIKTLSNNDSLTLFLPASNPNKLGIRAENAEKQTTNTWMMKLFDTNVENIELPNIQFTSIITMPSSDFQKICRDFNALAEKLEITSSNSDLIFRCIGDFVDGETVILSESQGGVRVQKTTSAGASTTEIVQGIFELKYLVMFTKCTNLCPTIEIYLKNDYPLVLRYMVANLGEVRVVLAPQKQKTDGAKKAV